MSYFYFLDFCRSVSRHIRFRPDRRGVEEELMDHLLDRRDTLKEAGVPDGEAEERAVAAMGDPAEIGRALDRYHSPLLGWTQIVVLWLVVLLGIAGLCLTARTLWEERPFRAGDDETFQGTATALEGDSIRVGDYTFTLEKVRQYPGYEGKRDVSFRLNITWLSPWLDVPEYSSEPRWADASGAWRTMDLAAAVYDPELGWRVSVHPDEYRHTLGWMGERLDGPVLLSNRETEQYVIRELPEEAAAVGVALDCGGREVFLEFALEGGMTDG